MNTNGNTAQQIPNQSVGENINNTNLRFPISGNLGGASAQLTTTGYSYSYPYPWYNYSPDYALTSRIASLEGEVRVLREMVAALLSGKAPKASSAKR